MTQLFKDFPPGWGHLRVPVSDRRSALAGLTLYSACNRRALWAQRAAWTAVSMFGPRVLPGTATPWLPVERDLWAELTDRWRRELGPFDAMAGYQRTAAARVGFAVLLLRRGSPFAFVKLQPDGARGHDLGAEARATTIAWSFRPRSFTVPEPLSSGRVQEWRYFGTSALPARLHRPPDHPPLDAIVEEIEACLGTLPRPEGTPDHWRRMHGDFAPWNLRQSGRELFLIDWEHAGWGPPQADAILYRLASSALRTGHTLAPWSHWSESREAIAYWDNQARTDWHGSLRDDRFATRAEQILGSMKAVADVPVAAPVPPPLAVPSSRAVRPPDHASPPSHAVASGMLDAGLSSLATFVIGVYAAQALSPTMLGGVALVFAAFAVGGIIPDMAVFTPLEVLTVEHPPRERLSLLPQTLRLGLLPSLLSALSVAFWTLVAPAELPLNVVAILTITGIMYAFLSPIQDHVRRMLHSAGLSWLAAVVAGTQLVVVSGGVAVVHYAGLPPWWAPFGLLALANAVSLCVGLALADRRQGPDVAHVEIRWSDVAQSGRWLFLVGVVPAVMNFAVSAVVSFLAGPAVLGYAEAARVASQPLLVLTMGLSATFGPKIITSTRARNRRESRRLARQFMGLMVIASVLCLAVAGYPWAGNPLARLLPNAYVVGGLTAAMLLRLLAHALSEPGRFQMLGAKRERNLAFVELWANAMRGGISSAASLMGAFTIPIGAIALSIVRIIGQESVLRSYYAETSTAETSTADTSTADTSTAAKGGEPAAGPSHFGPPKAAIEAASGT